MLCVTSYEIFISLTILLFDIKLLSFGSEYNHLFCYIKNNDYSEQGLASYVFSALLLIK